MNITIVDNNDLMLEIWASNPDTLTSMASAHLFKKHHMLNDNLWLVRCNFSAFDDILAHLQHVEYKIVLTRFTSGTQYFSSDPNDSLAGHNIIG